MSWPKYYCLFILIRLYLLVHGLNIFIAMSSTSVIVADAQSAWKCLNGLFCIYKPADIPVIAVKSAIITNVCRTLNELIVRPVSQFVDFEGPADKLAVVVRPDYSDHPLVVGPRYQPPDVRLTWATRLGIKISGVLVVGVNYGTKQSMAFHNARPLRTYRLKGRLGLITDNMYKDGRVIEKAKYGHVKISHLHRVLATMQSAHQKQMFQQTGVDIQSQTGYEVAVKGLIRPSSNEVPIVYNLKAIDFEPPYFTIEVTCINENEDYLLNIVNNIGGRLRCLAVCTGLQCIQHGCFTTEDALLRKHWSTEHIINNISHCLKVMESSKFKLEHQPYLVDSAVS